MPSNNVDSPRPHRWALALVVATLALAILALLRGASLRAEAPEVHPPGHHGQHHMPMTDEDMRRWTEAWYAQHPRVGAPATGAPVDTFSVFSFGYDNDGIFDEVDTAFVFTGESVLFKFSDGFHTATNGTGFQDPNAGTLFDQPIDPQHTEFAFTFEDVGTVPVFCRPHEGLMSCYVVVSEPTDVLPISDAHARIGFLDGPAPNPTREATTFRFALAGGGRVKVDVYDVRGRRVATPIDRELRPGTYAARWDGRTRHGEPATAGVYYLRLTVPGASDTREVVVTR